MSEIILQGLFSGIGVHPKMTARPTAPRQCSRELRNAGTYNPVWWYGTVDTGIRSATLTHPNEALCPLKNSTMFEG